MLQKVSNGKEFTPGLDMQQTAELKYLGIYKIGKQKELVNQQTIFCLMGYNAPYSFFTTPKKYLR